MGRTAAQFAESSVPNGIQRKIPPAQIQKKKENRIDDSSYYAQQISPKNALQDAPYW